MQSFDVGQCLLHRAARGYGEASSALLRCPCCGRAAAKHPLPVCFSLDSLYYKGTGLVLYLTTVKYLTLLLLGLCLTFSLPIMYLNYRSSACLALNCSDFMVLSAINATNSSATLALRTYLLPISVALILLTSQLLRKTHRQVKQNADKLGLLPEGYAVTVNIDQDQMKEEFIQEEIILWWKKEYVRRKDHLKQIFPEMFTELLSDSRDLSNTLNCSNTLYKVLISCSISQFQRVRQELTEIEEFFRQEASVSNPRNISKLQSYSETREGLCRSLRKTNFCVLVFRTRRHAEYFLQKNLLSRLEHVFCFEDSHKIKVNRIPLSVAPAPLPSEIYWGRHEVSRLDKLKARALAWSLTLLAVLLSLGLPLGMLSIWRLPLRDAQISDFPISISLLISCSNYILVKVLLHFTRKEHRSTKASQNIYCLYRQVMLSLLNSGVLLLAAYLLQANQTFLWTESGFIDTLSYSFLLSIALPHLEKYFNLSALRSYHAMLTLNGSQAYTQQQANAAFEKPQHNVTEQNAWTVTIIYAACLFAPLIPYTFVCGAISMALHFCLEKINIAKFYSEADNSGDQLSNATIDLIDKAPVLLVAGNLILQLALNSATSSAESSLVLYLNIGLLLLCSFSSFLLPGERVNKMIVCHSEAETVGFEYASRRDSFLELYEKSSPVHLYLGRDQENHLEQREKITEELNSLSKILSLTLKERLLSNMSPVISQMKLGSREESELGEVYFEYERRITMPMHTNGKVPPLFLRPLPGPQTETCEHPRKPLVNLGTLFLGDDNAKRMIKEKIRLSIQQGRIARELL